MEYQFINKNKTQVVIVGKDTDLSKVDFVKGATLLVRKPLNWTSFDVVSKIRNKLKNRFLVKSLKVGHAGTLDPLATGLLILCTGQNTKLAESLQGMNKGYHAVIKLGAVTESYDKEMAEQNITDTSKLDMATVESAVSSFLGDSEQIPPMFSAIKKNGVPLYKMAREGKTIERAPRPITISELDIVSFENPMLEIKSTVTKGTYIRSLAHDIGAKLGVGGYLYSLERTSVGEYKLEDAIEIETLIDFLEPATTQE